MSNRDAFDEMKRNEQAKNLLDPLRASMECLPFWQQELVHTLEKKLNEAAEVARLEQPQVGDESDTQQEVASSKHKRHASR